MSLDIKYTNEDVVIKPLTKIVDNTLTINLPNQYYIDQEEKKLNIAKQSFNNSQIDKQYNAFRRFLTK